MTRHRLVMLLAAVGLAASSLAGPAWAHPGHGPIGESAVEAAARLAPGHQSEMDPLSPIPVNPRASPRHSAPPAVALVAGALALLASIPHRRRTLALALGLLLALVAFEGAFHAALHLRHLPHADGLAIGASAGQQAAADLASAAPAATPLALLGEAPQPYDAPVTDVAVSSDQGRAPPVSPA